MDDQPVRAYVNSLWRGLLKRDPGAFERLHDVLFVRLPSRFQSLHLLQENMETVVVNAIRRVAARVPEILPPACRDFYDWVLEEADKEPRDWSHDLQRRLKEWDRARVLQARLLTGRAPAIPGLEVACHHLAARELTGDLYGFYNRGDEFTLIALSDAQGKGPAAAMYGAVVMGCLKSQAAQLSHPAEILRGVNALVPGLEACGHSATHIVMLWNQATKKMTFASAGGVPPLLRRDSGWVPLDLTGFATGWRDGVEYDSLTVEARAGDLLVIHSDGITDQDGPSDKYGPERLAALVATVDTQSCDEVLTAIFQDVERFADGAARTDDQTVIVVRVRE